MSTEIAAPRNTWVLLGEHRTRVIDYDYSLEALLVRYSHHEWTMRVPMREGIVIEFVCSTLTRANQHVQYTIRKNT